MPSERISTVKSRTVPAAPQWQSLGREFEDLQAIVDRLAATCDPPEGVAVLLGTSRKLLLHSWFAYDFGLVAVAWSFVAVEAGIRERLREMGIEPPSGMHALTKAGFKHGLFEEKWTVHLDAGRRLRNAMIHGRMLGPLSPGMVEEALHASHALIAELFPHRSP